MSEQPPLSDAELDALREDAGNPVDFPIMRVSTGAVVRLIEEVRRLRSVLQWYADERHWDDEGRAGQYEWSIDEDRNRIAEFELDYGERALDALPLLVVAGSDTGEESEP